VQDQYALTHQSMSHCSLTLACDASTELMLLLLPSTAVVYTPAEKPVAPGQVVLSMEPANNGSTYPPTLPPPGPLFPTLPPASTALQAPATAGNGAGSGAGAYPTIGAAEGLLVAPGNTPGSGRRASPAVHWQVLSLVHEQSTHKVTCYCHCCHWRVLWAVHK
jgi:hypothetical protein